MEKHITPIDLENMVISIKHSKSLEPIDLPMPSSLKSSDLTPQRVANNVPASEGGDADPAYQSVSRSTLLESSASTFNTEGSNDYP